MLSKHYNMKVESWAKQAGFNAFIVCNNAPRWSAVINYDWLTSPLLGYAISQDNIGGPTSRIGPGGHGRYCDFCNAKFLHYLTTTGKLPEFRRKYGHIRDYLQTNLGEVLDDVLLVGEGDVVKVGTPRVEGAKVTARVVEQGRSPKILVFKYKRRKGYRRKRGHRQHYTRLQIVDISA